MPRLAPVINTALFVMFIFQSPFLESRFLLLLRTGATPGYGESSRPLWGSTAPAAGLTAESPYPQPCRGGGRWFLDEAQRTSALRLIDALFALGRTRSPDPGDPVACVTCH